MKAKKTVIFSVIAVSLIFLAYTVMVEDMDTANRVETTETEFSGEASSVYGETDSFNTVKTANERLETGYDEDDSILVSENLTIETTMNEELPSQSLTSFTLQLSFENGSLSLHQSSGNKSLAIDLEIVGEAYVFTMDDGETLVFEVDAYGCGLLEAELEARRYWVESSVDGRPESWSGSGHLKFWNEFLRSLLFSGELED